MNALPQLDPGDFYQQIHTGNPHDVEFYQRVVGDAASVLELGCGWGRVSIPLVSSGRQVVGLDENAEFVSRARQLATAKNGQVDFVCGDARSFELGRKFERIIIAYNTLYCLGGVEGLDRCLQSAVKHLEDGGQLWFDAYPIDDFHDAVLEGTVPDEDDDTALITFRERAAPHRLLDVFETTDIDAHRQRLEVRYEARDASGGVVGRHTITHHYLTSAQVFAALEKAGLDVILWAGSFEGAPPTDEAEQLIWGAEATA